MPNANPRPGRVLAFIGLITALLAIGCAALGPRTVVSSASVHAQAAQPKTQRLPLPDFPRPTSTALPTPTAAPTAPPAWIEQAMQELQASVEHEPLAGVVVGVRVGSQPPVILSAGLANVSTGAPAQANTAFQIASITKQFTAAAVMQLAEAGKLSLDDPVARFYPDLPASAQSITLRRLLTHTSGLPDWVGAKIQTYEVDQVIPPEASQISLGGVFAQPLFAPDAAWSYNNTGFWILGRIIEQVSGETYAGYLQNHLLGPLGLRHTRYCTDPGPGDAQGYELDAEQSGFHPIKTDMRLLFSAGGLCSTAGDLLAWQQALASGRVVSLESYRQMTTPVQLANGRTNAYGFGLSLSGVDGQAAVSHGGLIPGFQSFLVNYPARDLTLVLLTNTDSGSLGALRQRILKLVLPLTPSPQN